METHSLDGEDDVQPRVRGILADLWHMSYQQRMQRKRLEEVLQEWRHYVRSDIHKSRWPIEDVETVLSPSNASSFLEDVSRLNSSQISYHANNQSVTRDTFDYDNLVQAGRIRSVGVIDFPDSSARQEPISQELRSSTGSTLAARPVFPLGAEQAMSDHGSLFPRNPPTRAKTSLGMLSIGSERTTSSVDNANDFTRPCSPTRQEQCTLHPLGLPPNVFRISWHQRPFPPFTSDAWDVETPCRMSCRRSYTLHSSTLSPSTAVANSDTGTDSDETVDADNNEEEEPPQGS